LLVLPVAAKFAAVPVIPAELSPKILQILV